MNNLTSFAILYHQFGDFTQIGQYILETSSPFHRFKKMLLEFLFSSNIFTVIMLSALFLIWYFLFFRPFNFYRDFTEYGFEDILKQNQHKSNAARRDIINEMRKRRKVGTLPPSFPNGWFAILESDQISAKTAKEIELLGLNLVAWRGESGKCYVADAYCPHLGAHLGIGGKVHGDCIECPFHGWSFDGCSGKLKNIPYAETVPDLAKLNMWTTIEMYGFVYIWYHAEQQEPTWRPDVVPEIDSKSWRYRGRSEFRVTCHIQEIPENGADVAHLSTVHGSPAFAGTCPEDSKLTWTFLKRIWSASWLPNGGTRTHEANLTVTHQFSLFNKINFCDITVHVRQLGPGIVLLKFQTILGDGMLIQNVTPLEPLLQRITHRFYSSPCFLHPLALLVLQGEAIQISRDIRIWNRKTFIKNPILTKEDKQIKSFRRWYSQFYSESSEKPSFKSNKLYQLNY